MDKSGGVVRKAKAQKEPATPRKEGSNIPVANPDPGGRNDARLKDNTSHKGRATAETVGASKESPVKKKAQKNSGWFDGKGKPVPLYQPKKPDGKSANAVSGESTTAPVTSRKTQKISAASPLAPSTPKRAARKTEGKGKKQDKTEDKIVFTRIRMWGLVYSTYMMT